ncbi:uncharacterized protein LOC125779283 isoform X2 [Bactrocera dorsalis]|uniref:Uncharacterized protein LOC125779283 isoform X2 n=1 Tax=Bactrocera dorsalis TaxID=27457 RepID=A0ABM3K4R3_BACDO|nr:uncharacterized protein LOC125779283 isoform X2 [Bactrocera dorsalis]
MLRRGKVKLPELLPPPQPLFQLLYGESPHSSHFLKHTKMYNDCFQMTSFGGEIVNEQNCNPTFKVHGQIFHLAGSLLPYPDQEHKYLQIYFLGDSHDEVNRRCAIFNTTKREQMLHEHSGLIKLFTISLERMPTDDHSIIIQADKRPTGTHERQYNAPTVSEISVVVVGENLQSRDIVIERRNQNALKRISETHRSYDAMQYPLMFCRGEDGYHLGYKMINPVNGVETNKKVSSMKFYACRMMIRQNYDNHLLRYGRLFQQYEVDMYVKVETERLNYMRYNQSKLRSEEYIHLRDAMIGDADITDIGRLYILPSTYIGSPRHMHEYSQDAMTYVRNYGRPDLFVTFTCNPKWPDITNLLHPGQSPRYDVTARVFKQKLRCLMDFITKQRVYGTVRCWMYSVKWQKRGLPHAHILLWMVEKITPDQIDDIISAEIPDVEIDPELHEVVMANMVHGPCGEHDPSSVCMSDSKCKKRYPRAFISKTQTGNDGYPLYRRRSPADNGRTFITQLKGKNFVVDNTWFVPYSPILSKAFKTHINVEYCSSIKSIKYVCK